MADSYNPTLVLARTNLAGLGASKGGITFEDPSQIRDDIITGPVLRLIDTAESLSSVQWNVVDGLLVRRCDDG